MDLHSSPIELSRPVDSTTRPSRSFYIEANFKQQVNQLEKHDANYCISGAESRYPACGYGNSFYKGGSDPESRFGPTVSRFTGTGPCSLSDATQREGRVSIRLTIATPDLVQTF